ncbi:hypothetical protein ELQ35_21600 [Peribacillus cavernae]|uniref:Aminotransferase yhxA n=1 Tax=Peribacillus cavernae TaxID=1674310 RepID=A0A433H891_9BACI|nr:hypothetical protein [Peribacillus cavernae]MDQ0220962.1 uncharacterized lipoprotein YehR (DUF1307 family) [Peribacillus cavernae]RUQ24513.1 hypothetical protein ELQ35_21600 [Peribacillus cavernae]
MNKTKKMMSGVAAALFAVSVTGCSESSARPAKPSDKGCDDWEFDKDTGTYYCDDSSSGHHGAYYYGGRYYNSKSALKKSSGFASYQKSYKSGIGSSSKGGSFGG